MAKAIFSTSQQIFLCVAENPKREGTASHPIFDLYFNCRTVGEFLAAGGRRADIIWDMARGYIILDWEQEVPATPAPVVQAAAAARKTAAKKPTSGIAAMVAQLAPKAAKKVKPFSVAGLSQGVTA